MFYNGLLKPQWPAPPNVVACTTLREGGFSLPPYNTFNLALHVGDQAASVQKNRRHLAELIALPAENFVWLDQVHGTRVLEAAAQPFSADLGELPQADGVFSRQPDRVCVVMTADCLPVLFTDARGSWVAAAHAGWRGLLSGILEATLVAYPGDRRRLIAWLGPAIGPAAFVVGDEVRQAFLSVDPALGSCFSAAGDPDGKSLLDIYAAARSILQRAGVYNIYGGGFCTVADESRFFSFRRNKVTGRMASLIYLKSA
jgi:YfiH family protein